MNLSSVWSFSTGASKTRCSAGAPPSSSGCTRSSSNRYRFSWKRPLSSYAHSAEERASHHQCSYLCIITKITGIVRYEWSFVMCASKKVSKSLQVCLMCGSNTTEYSTLYCIQVSYTSMSSTAACTYSYVCCMCTVLVHCTL